MRNAVEGIADDAVRRWQAVETALAPVIGPRGVAALYQRSVLLCRAQHPSLTLASADAPHHIDLAALHAALLRQLPVAAEAASAAALQTFFDLLGQLIGHALTERLIGPAPLSSSTGPAVQDATP